MCVLVDWEISDQEKKVVHDTWPAGLEIVIGAHVSDDGRETLLKRTDVVVGKMNSVTTNLLNGAPSLRLVHMLGHGVDSLLRPPIPHLLAEKGVRVATSDAAGPGIAEYVMMSLIALGRQVIPMHNALATRGAWQAVRAVPELGGSTLCVLGLGAIGLEVVKLGRAFGMHTLGVTRTPGNHRLAPDGPDQLFPYSEIEQALRGADHVVVCAPLTRDTAGLLDKKHLAAVKNGAFLVNVARGEIVDEDALYESLASGTLAGAAIDAWWSDRTSTSLQYPSRHPIHQFNVIMTPHCCGATAATRQRALATVGQNLARLEAGEPLLNEVRMTTMTEMAIER